MHIGGNMIYSLFSTLDFNRPLLPTRNIDITSLEELLGRKDYPTILKSSELFLSVYYRAMNTFHKNDSMYSVSRQGNTIKVKWDNSLTEIEKGVERVRVLLESQYREKKTCTILPITIAIETYLQTPSPQIIDLSNSTGEESGRISHCLYRDYILPVIPRIAEIIGAIFSATTLEQHYNSGYQTQTCEIKGFTITFLASEHFIYPIEPVTISARDSMEKSMYDLYKDKDQPLCTLVLRTAGDSEVRMHPFPFYQYGGDALKKMIGGHFKETRDQAINFSHFSDQTVREFVEFLYLGPNALTPEVFFAKEVNLCELLDMAHTYQVPLLVDCCTNLLSLVATPDQAGDIKRIADMYENSHLQKLCEHLTTPPAKPATTIPAFADEDKLLEVD